MKKIIGVLSLLFSVGIVSAQTLTTLAGTGNSGYNGDNIPATTANLYSPLRVIEDNSGNIVIADRSNARVRRIDKVTGLISTVTTDVYTPAALAKDALGNIFVTEEEIGRVRKIDAVTGIVSTVAGSGFNGYGGDGGPASSAILSNPRGIAIANDGTIYIADLSNNRIRKVDATTGIITTMAGTGVGGFSGDGGQAVSAELKFPFDVALDASNNNIYIADGQNSRIRKVNLITGIITTVAGNGVDGSSGDGGLATNAQLGLPMGVFVLGNDNIFIADYSQGRIRVVNKAGIISTVLNNGVGSPSGVIVNSEGSLYIPGAGANRVFKLIPLDSDNDGIFNGIDNCPSSANPGQTDSDGDGSGDACDFEPNDPTKFPGASCTSANECVEAAVYDASGNCVASLFRPAGYVCSTGQCNGLGTCAPPDTDGDGVPDSSDNCPSRANTNQTDSDGDGRGDVCDNCPSVANPDQLDTNGNGEGDACESSVRVKINEIYGAGGFNGASYINDFVELYNASSSAIDLQGLSLQYSTANGSSWQAISLSGSIAPYGYFLIELGSNGPNGESLPTADLVVPVLNLAPTAGKLALVNGEELLIESCPTGSQIIDFVGYHPLANCFEGLNAPFNHLVISIERMVAGQDTNNNSFDFMNTSPPTPQHGLFVADADNDGVPDSSDNCPSTENADQADGDNDAIGDVCDACPADANNDTDDDGFCDNLDFAPNDPTKYPGAPCGSQNGCSISSGYDAFGNCMVVYLPAGTACSTGECDGAGNCSTINSAPTLPASNITFTNIFSDRMQINFIPGNGENRLLVMRQGSPVSWTPVDGEDYETSESFSEATDLGDGNKVVTPNAAGLLPSTTYYVKVFEFSGTGALTQYLLTGAPVAIKKTTPLPNVYVSSPVNNAINQKWNLNITARTVTGAITYTIELNKNADFIGESIIQSGARTQTFNGLEFGATYFTRVKTELRPEYGKVTHFTVATPAYYSYVYTPANGAINQKVSLNIVSNLVPDATEYTIQISPEDDFSSDVIERTGPTRSLAFSGLSYNTIYHTQVRTNLSPEFGQVRSFTTRTAESLAYVTSPANGAVDRKTKLNITSNPVPGATSYTIQLSEDEEFGEIAFEATGPTRTRSFSGLTPGTKYYNRVTTDAPGTVGFGQVRNFTTAGIPPGARLSSTTTLGDPVETGELMEFDVRVYPNPFHEKLIFHIEARVAQQATVTLMDVNGKAVHESVEQTNATIEIEKPLTAGVYLLRVKAGSQYKMIRVVKSD